MISRFVKKARRTPRRKLKGKGERKPRRYRRSTRYRASLGSGTCVIANGTITWTLPRKLRSLNVLCSRLARFGDTKAWEKQFTDAKLVASDHTLGPSSKQRLKLSVMRLAPSKAFFLDRTNLCGGVKGLEDALVRLEFLVDDAEEWEDGPHCSQGLSDDKKYWTVVTLEVISQDGQTNA
jgi:hypothetical protein